MNTKTCAISLSLLAGACALAIPGISQAGNVGYYAGCYESAAAKAPLITQAGHTPVAVASLTAAALAPLQKLVIENCNGANISTQINPDVKAAVSAGMQLVVYDWNPNGGTAAALPGAPAAVIQYGSGSQIDLVAGAPITTGPGGTLTDTSLDGGGSSNHGYATSIPVGSQAFLTTADHSQIVAFSYAVGAGSVIYSAIPFDCYATVGAACDSYPAAPGIRSYFVNVLSPGGTATSCTSEGYKGTQLTWCRNICENGLTGQVLDTWIHRWILRYRDLPYCAVE